MDGLRIRDVSRGGSPPLPELLRELEPEAARLRWRCEFGELVAACAVTDDYIRDLHERLERRDGISWSLLVEYAREADPFANARLVAYERVETDPTIELAKWDDRFWEVLSTSHSLLERIRDRYPDAESISYPDKKSPWRWGTPAPGPIE
jgi:hypothetical protein